MKKTCIIFASALLAFVWAAHAATFQWLRTNSGSGEWNDPAMWTVSGEAAGDIPGAEDWAMFGTQNSGQSFKAPVLSGSQACYGLSLQVRDSGYTARTLIFSGTNNAVLAIGAGGITLSQGNQYQSDSGIAATIAIELTADQTWTHNSNKFYVHSAISGTHRLTLSGSEAVYLNLGSMDSTFTGGTIHAGGYTIFRSSTVDETGVITCGSFGTGTLELRGGLLNAGGARTLHNDVLHTGDTTVNYVTFAVATNAGFTVSAAAGNPAPAFRTTAASTINRPLSDDPLAPAEAFRKTGASTLTLAGADSTFTGRVVIAEGTLIVNPPSALGPAPAVPVTNQLELAGGFLNFPETTALNEPTRGVYVTGGGFDVPSGKTLTIGASLSGNGMLTKKGAGSLVFTPVDTDALGLEIAQGGVVLNGTGAHLAFLAGYAVSRLDLNLATLTLSGAGTNFCSTPVHGDGALVFTGAGHHIFAGTNTFTGGVTLASGRFVALHDSALGTGPVLLNGGTLELTGVQAGLWEGELYGAQNTADPNPKSAIHDGLRMAQTNTGWGTAQTWVYTGQLYVHENPSTPGSRTVTFGCNNDEFDRLIINGQTIINDASYTRCALATITLDQGWHDIELRVGNSSGGGGPNGADGWPRTMGFGIDWEGRGVTDVGNFTIPADPGDASLLRIGPPISPCVGSFTWHGGTIATSLGSDAVLHVEGAFTKTGNGPYTFDFNGTGESGKTYLLATFDTTDFSAADFSAANLPVSTEGPFDAIFSISGNQLFVKTTIRRATLLLIR